MTWSPSIRRAAQPLLLLLAFAASVAARIATAGPGPARSVPAGFLFTVLLLAIGWGAGYRPPPSGRTIRTAALVGACGGAVICVPAIAARLAGAPAHRPSGDFWAWAAAVTVVAAAEELFLRGVLFDSISHRGGSAAAVVTGAVAFAGLHVPLYGWHVVPLDLAVGIWLGVLRLTAGSWIAPGVAHVAADVAGWWLR